MKSAMMSLELLNAVSPDVIGAATTPRSARMAPNFPRVVLVISFTAHDASLPCSASAALSPARESSTPLKPLKKAIAAAAQMSAIMLSDIIAP